MNQYFRNNLTKEWLLSHNFRYNRLLSTDNAIIYTYRFPVYKYKGMTVLECELSAALGCEDIKINVYDYNTNDKYAAFYYCDYGNFNRMLKIIWNKIDEVLQRLQIEKA